MCFGNLYLSYFREQIYVYAIHCITPSIGSESASKDQTHLCFPSSGIKTALSQGLPPNNLLQTFEKIFGFYSFLDFRIVDKGF